MDFETFFLKLKAAYQAGIQAVVPYRHQHQVMTHPKDKNHEWLDEMLEEGSLVFAEDLLDVLEFAIEGKSYYPLSLYVAGL